MELGIEPGRGSWVGGLLEWVGVGAGSPSRGSLLLEVP